MGKHSKLEHGKTWEKFPTVGGGEKIHKVPKFHLGTFSKYYYMKNSLEFNQEFNTTLRFSVTTSKNHSGVFF